MIIFRKEQEEGNKYDHDSIIMEIPDSDISLFDLIGCFERFLRACGYNFNGELIIDYNNETLNMGEFIKEPDYECKEA